MREIFLIHCFSCGHDCTASVVEQKIGNPIKRCGNCRSLNFRILERVPVVDDETPMEFVNLGETEEKCVT
jgi:uncharacterized Zn finger protein